MKNRIVRVFTAAMLVIASAVSFIVPAAPVLANSNDGKADLAAPFPTAGSWVSGQPLVGVTGSKVYFQPTLSGANTFVSYVYDGVNNAWTALAKPPYDVSIGAQIATLSATTTAGRGWTIADSSGNSTQVWKWNYLVDTYDSWGTATTGTTSADQVIFEDEAHSVLHVVANVTGFKDFSHSSTSSAGGWTNNGNFAPLVSLAGVTEHFRLSTGVHIILDGQDYSKGYKFTESSQTYATITTTVVGGAPSGGLHGVWNSGDTIYGLFFGVSSPTDFRNVNWLPQVYKYADGTGWTFYTDQWDFGGSVNLMNVTYSTTWCVPIAQAPGNGVIYLMPGTMTTTHSNIKMERVYGLAVSQNIAQFPAYHTTGTAVTSGTVTGITWTTPRAAFQDEQFGFTFAATANLVMKPQVVDSKGTVIVPQVTLQNGTDGGQVWNNLNFPANFTGFFKCVETVTGVTSTWGYCTYAKVAGFTSPKSYAKYLDTTARDISNFYSADSDMNIMAWRTTLGTGDMGSYEFRIFLNDTTSVYGLNYSDMNSVYFQTVYSANNGMANTRYVLFEFNAPTGYNSYDSLIVNLALPITTGANNGFYDGCLVQTSDHVTKYTTPFSVYWYVQQSYVITAKMDKNSYAPNESAQIKISIASIAVAFTLYDTLKYYVVNSAGTAVTTQTVGSHNQEYDSTLIVPATADSYNFKAELSKAGGSVPATYALYAFKVTGSAAPTDPLKAGESALGNIGMNNTWGKMAVVIVAMVFIFLVCVIGTKGSKVGVILGSIMAMMVFGLGLVTGWLPWVIIVALALGGGIFLVKAILSMRQGGADE